MTKLRDHLSPYGTQVSLGVSTDILRTLSRHLMRGRNQRKPRRWKSLGYPIH